MYVVLSVSRDDGAAVDPLRYCPGDAVGAVHVDTQRLWPLVKRAMGGGADVNSGGGSPVDRCRAVDVYPTSGAEDRDMQGNLIAFLLVAKCSMTMTEIKDSWEAMTGVAWESINVFYEEANGRHCLRGSDGLWLVHGGEASDVEEGVLLISERSRLSEARVATLGAGRKRVRKLLESSAIDASRPIWFVVDTKGRNGSGGLLRVAGSISISDAEKSVVSYVYEESAGPPELANVMREIPIIGERLLVRLAPLFHTSVDGNVAYATASVTVGDLAAALGQDQ